MRHVLPLGLLLATGCADDEPAAAADVADAEAPTWSGSARAVVADNCATCHFEGGAAPFPLQTHAQAAPLAEALLAAVEDGRMPPWSADPDCRDVEDPRLMSEADLEALRAWVAGGALEGDATEPIAASSSDLDANLELPAPEPYTPDFSEATDDYRCFVYDQTFDRDVYLTASQVVPDTPQVHHALAYALTGSQIETMEALDEADPGNGYTCFGGPIPLGGDAGIDSGFPIQVAAWVPGAAPQVFPEDQAVRIPAGARVVMQLHYSAQSDGAAPDETALRLNVTDQAPDWLITTRPLGAFDLDIPAGESRVVAQQSYTNWSNRELQVRTTAAHMHKLGTRLSGTIDTATGEAECLLEVPDWDFDWQQAYILSERATVAPGDTVTVQCEFDNSAENQAVVNGEQLEPQDVAWGDGTSDEMCVLYLGFVEPFSPTPDPSAAACAGTEACVEACDGASWGCLMTCEDYDADCLSCSLEVGVECSFSECTTELLAARDCLEDCATQSFLLAGATGTCMAATCPEAYADLVDCGDPALQAGACDEALLPCGVAF